MKAFAIAAAAALAVCGGAAAAQGFGASSGTADLARFDARAGDDLARKFAICDATRFLANNPELDADKVLVRRRDGRLDLLLPPYFVGGPQWYDEDIERAYRRMKTAGQVDYESVRAARRDVGRDMVKSFDRVNGSERVFLREQSRFCETVEDLGKRG
jgi:hypothetical protein